MEILVVVVVMAVAIAVIIGPLLRQRRQASPVASPELAELDAAKEAKLREIREAELDHRLGKLSKDDWRALDATLRGQAIEILHKIDALEPDDQAEGAQRPQQG